MSSSEPRSRALASAYVRRFSGWSRLCRAFARALGVGPEDILDPDAGGDPVVFLSARTQHGEFAVVVEAFIDERRAPRWSGKDGLVRDLARELGEDLLYDDGASPVPCRWVLVQPDGERFEVFERADASGPDLVLDLEAPPRRLDPRPSGQSMSGGRAVGVQGGAGADIDAHAHRSDEELERQIATLDAAYGLAAAMGAPVPEGALDELAALRSELQRRRSPG